MLTNPIFSLEQQAIAPATQTHRYMLAGLAAIATLGTLAPIMLPQMPKPFKTGLLGAGLLSSAFGAAMTFRTPTEVKIEGAIANQQIEQLRSTMAHQVAYQTTVKEMESELLLISTIQAMPETVQQYYMQKYGFAAMAQAQRPAMAQTVDVTPQSSVGYVHDLNIDDWEAEQQEAAGLSAPVLYAKAIKEHMIWAGNQGEGKSVAAQYALAQWADVDPNLVPFWFDAHYGSGRDPRYEAHWLGIPHLKTMPKNVQTGVFKGEAKDLLPFLRLVQKLFRYRRTNDVRSPEVVVGIEEATNLIPQLNDQDIAEISGILAELGTEAPKFGMRYWLICHTLTKEEILIERKVLRQAHVVMGVEMTQDKVQVGNCPRSLSKDAIDQAQIIYREYGKPAGFVTSLPVPDGYLPKPPVNDTRDLIRDWVKTPELMNETASKAPALPERTANPYKNLKDWMTTLGRVPSDDEILEAWKQITGLSISKEAIANLRKDLDKFAA